MLSTLLGPFVKLRKATTSFVMSVCPHGTTRLQPNGFSWNLIFAYFSKNCRENSNWNRTRTTCTLREDEYTFLIISRSVLLRMRNVSDKSCRENLYVKTNIHFWSYLAQFFLEWEIFQTNVVEKIKPRILFSFFENRAVYEIMWKNPAEPGKPQMTIWHMRAACRITKATHTHSQ